MKKEEMLQKPTLVARQEFIENLVKLINESGVPLIVIHPVIEGVVCDVSKAIQQQYEIEKAQYEKLIEENAVGKTADSVSKKEEVASE